MRRGAWQHFFFPGELRISVTRGPHGRAMPPAPSYLSPRRIGCVKPAKSPAAARQSLQ